MGYKDVQEFKLKQKSHLAQLRASTAWKEQIALNKAQGLPPPPPLENPINKVTDNEATNSTTEGELSNKRKRSEAEGTDLSTQNESPRKKSAGTDSQTSKVQTKRKVASKISVYIDEPTMLSSKRKAEDSSEQPKAKRIYKGTMRMSPAEEAKMAAEALKRMRTRKAEKLRNEAKRLPKPAAFAQVRKTGINPRTKEDDAKTHMNRKSLTPASKTGGPDKGAKEELGVLSPISKKRKAEEDSGTPKQKFPKLADFTDREILQKQSRPPTSKPIRTARTTAFQKLLNICHEASTSEITQKRDPVRTPKQSAQYLENKTRVEGKVSGKQKEPLNRSSALSSKDRMGARAPASRDHLKHVEHNSIDPKGLRNFAFACFGNAPLQCLSGIPELSRHYAAQAENVLEETSLVLKKMATVDHPGKATKAVTNLRNEVKNLLVVLEDRISIGAYFGEVVQNLHTDGARTPVSAFIFLQAYGQVVKNAGESLDGETQQEAWQFVSSLLDRLDQEQQASGGMSTDKGSLVRELFNVKTGYQRFCTMCSATSESSEEHWTLNVALQQSKEATSLAELLTNVRTEETLADYRCDGCQLKDRVRGKSHIRELSRYLVVQAPRVVTKKDRNGLMVYDNKGDIQTVKVQTNIEFPREPLDLSGQFQNDHGKGDCVYEVFGIVEHRGMGTDSGHYIALRKIHDQWWLCDDEKVMKLPEEKLSRYQKGQLFFLRRVE